MPGFGRLCRILVVDDDISWRTRLCEKLTNSGMEVVEYSESPQSLMTLRHEPLDAVVCGQNLLDTCQSLFRGGRFPASSDTAVLVVVEAADIHRGMQALTSGATDMLIKPFHLDFVGDLIRRAIARKRMETEVGQFRQRLSALVEESCDEIVAALGCALDLRDLEVAGHTRRVARYCQAIAGVLGCRREELNHIVRGAYLHDIGKVGVPDSILLKPAKLSEEETAVVQAHAEIGYNLIRHIPVLDAESSIVLTHHEQFDGGGYPQGLVSHEIPIGSRIFALTDVLDAMTTDRPYRRAVSWDVARQEIEREAGRHLDPEVVRAFLAIPQQVYDNIFCNGDRTLIRRSHPKAA
jgi:cyclic di-GMP phosphodiesterase